MDEILKKIDEIQEYVYGTEINKGAYEDFKKEIDNLRNLVKLFAIPLSVWCRAGFRRELVSSYTKFFYELQTFENR